MSLLGRIFGRTKKANREAIESENAASASRAVESADVRAEEVATHPLLRFGTASPPDEREALSLLEGLRHDVMAGSILSELLGESRRSALPASLRVRAAMLLHERGDIADARSLLKDDPSPHAIFLDAQFAHDQGEVEAAVGSLERLLAKQIDFPNALERHRAWSKELGRGAANERPISGATLLAPTVETPFTILREVARGGAGVVYEARDRELGRKVALKLYHDPKMQSAQLLREVRVASALRSAYVVRIFDVDPTLGWLAMEWSPGGSLRDARDLHWILPLALGLAHVHRSGFVHLDVKPSNVLSLEDGRVVLSDFGLARKIGEEVVGGSFGYVSDARLRGKRAEPKDDVFGFGKMLEEKSRGTALEAEIKALAAECLSGRLADGSAVADAISSAPWHSKIRTE